MPPSPTPESIHIGADDLPFVEIGDGSLLKVLQVKKGEGLLWGFGHRVYRTEDPRSALLKETALANGGGVVELAVEVEKVVLEELDAHRPDRALRTNVEFYAGVVLDQIGLPQPLFTGAFAVSRAVGWSAHIMEQITDNKIIRPSSRYVGPAPSAGAAA